MLILNSVHITKTHLKIIKAIEKIYLYSCAIKYSLYSFLALYIDIIS